MLEQSPGKYLLDEAVESSETFLRQGELQADYSGGEAKYRVFRQQEWIYIDSPRLV